MLTTLGGQMITRYGYYGGDHQVHWGLVVVRVTLVLVLFGALAWIIIALLRLNRDHHHPHPDRTPPPGAGREALSILDERFARGEVDEDDYKRRRTLLKGD